MLARGNEGAENEEDNSGSSVYRQLPKAPAGDPGPVR